MPQTDDRSLKVVITDAAPAALAGAHKPLSIWLGQPAGRVGPRDPMDAPAGRAVTEGPAGAASVRFGEPRK
jgi:hypothetical protein